MTENIEKYLLSDAEQLACSLISKYTYKQVKDVIKETCLHQIASLIEKGWIPPVTFDDQQKGIDSDWEIHNLGYKQGQEMEQERIRQAVEKVENPHRKGESSNETSAYFGFEQARQAILEALK